PPLPAGTTGPPGRPFGNRAGTFPAAPAITPAEAVTPTTSPTTIACLRFIDASSGDSGVGGVTEVHGGAEGESPVPTVVLPDRCVVLVDRRRALAHVLLGRRHVDRDPERVGAPFVGVPLGPARVPVDPVLDVRLQVGVLDVSVDVVVEVSPPPPLGPDHCGRTATELAMEAEPVRPPVVRRPPPHRDRPGLRVAGLAEAVDDLRVAARSRRVIHVLVPPTEPRPVEGCDQRQQDRDRNRAAEEPEPSLSLRTCPHDPPPRNPGEVGEVSE